MKRIILSIVLAVGSMYLAAAQTTIALDSFTSLLVTGNIQVFLERGDTAKAVLYAEGIPEDEIKIRVMQGTLRMASLNSFLYKDAVVRIYLTHGHLDDIRANAGASIRSEEIIRAAKLQLSAGSGALVELTLEASELDANVSEGARMNLQGSTGQQEVSAMTGGQYRSEQLSSHTAYIRSNTGARVDISVDERLEVSANTGGEVRYTGNPKNKYLKNILGGTVRHIQKESE